MTLSVSLLVRVVVALFLLLWGLSTIVRKPNVVDRVLGGLAALLGILILVE